MSENATTSNHKRNSDPQSGTMIADRYQVDKLVARGGMAAVYLAQHVKLNRPVALKILSPPPDADESGAFEERFRLEAETLASLDHPNIVILHDYGDLDDGRFFLAMEFIDGPRLSDVLRDGPLPCERALQLIMQVCNGLRYSHKRGVVHRDLKPSNLLIKLNDDGSEQLKIVDFGLVKLTEADQSITRAGLILGSPHCMAPEQVKGQQVDHRADIYAIGVLLFRTLTGQYPFHGPNSAATMIAHLNQPVPTFFNVAPAVVIPEGLEELVRKALAKLPADRYPSIQELMDDMAACMRMPPDPFRSFSQSQSTIQGRVEQDDRGGRGSVLRFGLAALGWAVVVAGSMFIGSMLQPDPVVIEVPVQAYGEDEEAIATPDNKQETPEKADGDTEEEGAEVAPEPIVQPRPRPRSVQVAAPKPAPQPVAEPTPAPAEEEEEEEVPTPEGYMGMPDDLFD